MVTCHVNGVLQGTYLGLILFIFTDEISTSIRIVLIKKKIRQSCVATEIGQNIIQTA